MTIERSIDNKTGATKDRITLTPEENAAMDTAHEIIKARAEAENASYVEELVEWWLLRHLRCDGIEKMLEAARTTPFRKEEPMLRGYC